MTRIFFLRIKKTSLESIFCWYPDRYSIYRMADLKSGNTFRNRTDGSLFCAKFCDYLLRLLPFMDWHLFFLSFFFFKIGTENSRNHPCYTRKSTGLRSYSMQCSLYRLTPSDRCCIPSGCCILWKIFHWYHWETLFAPWLPDSNPDGTD